MQNSRLVNILKTFSQKEVRDFRKWITSPAHNSREDVRSLFEYLTTRNHLMEEKFLAKERIYPKVYPKEKFDDAKMRQVIHFLSKTVENFLIYQELLEDEVQSKITLAGVFRKRKLDKSCEKTIKLSKSILDNSPFRDGQHLRNEYFLEQEKYGYLSGFQRTDLNLQEMSDALDFTYFADKLRQSCLMLSHQAVYKTEYEVGLIEQILKYVEEKNYLNKPAIAAYYFVYKTLTVFEEEHFFYQLKTEIDKHSQLFPDYEARNIYLMAINYCIKKMNQGKRGFIREAFELYKMGIEGEFLIENKTISRVTFLNAVINGTQLKEFDWVENFLHQYQEFIPASQRENISNYSFAHFYYEKGDYDNSMKYLIQYENDDVILNLNSKNILLKMYVEMGEYEALESLLGSMSSFLNRKKVMGYHKAIYSNLIKLTKKLIRINPYDKSEKSKLKTIIEETNPQTVSNRKWLLDQLQKL